MRDPEMCFELGFADGPELNPFFYPNDYAGVEQWKNSVVRRLGQINAYIDAPAGITDEAISVSATLIQMRKLRYVPAFKLCRLAHALGREDEAEEWLRNTL